MIGYRAGPKITVARYIGLMNNSMTIYDVFVTKYRPIYMAVSLVKEYCLNNVLTCDAQLYNSRLIKLTTP